MGAGGKSKTCWHGQWPWPKHAKDKTTARAIYGRAPPRGGKTYKREGGREAPRGPPAWGQNCGHMNTRTHTREG